MLLPVLGVGAGLASIKGIDSSSYSGALRTPFTYARSGSSLGGLDLALRRLRNRREVQCHSYSEACRNSQKVSWLCRVVKSSYT